MILYHEKIYFNFILWTCNIIIIFVSLIIVFKSLIQYGIQHILHPQLWYSSTPFYTSLQLQQGYSYGNDIVLLVAGANNPISGQGGSGIYAGKNGALAMYQPGERKMYRKFFRIFLFISNK